MDLNLLIKVFEKQEDGTRKIYINGREYAGQWRYFSQTVGYYSPAVKREEITLGENDIPETMGLFSGSFDGTKWNELGDFEKQSFIVNLPVFKSFIGISDEELDNLDEEMASSLWRGRLIFDGDVYDSTVHASSPIKMFTRVFLAEVFSPLYSRSVELYRNYGEPSEKSLEKRGVTVSRVFCEDTNGTVVILGNKYENPELLCIPTEEQCDSKQIDSIKSDVDCKEPVEEQPELFNSVIEYQGVKIKIFDVVSEGVEYERIEKMTQLIWDAKKEYVAHLEQMKKRTLESPDAEFCFPLSEEAFMATYLDRKIFTHTTKEEI